jgi:tetratricopeptide (TPR) repeat protein
VSVGHAYLEFAQTLTFALAPDLEAILGLYEKAAEAYPKDQDGWPLAIDHPVNEGVRKIASGFEARGEWERAAAAWRRWRPVSWCGNEGEMMREERLTRLARCLHLAGRNAEAISTLEEYLLGDRFLNGPFPSTVYAYLEISARAGSFEQAKRKLLASPANRKWMGLLAGPSVGGPSQEPVEGFWYKQEIEIVEGFAKREPVAILDALRGPDPLRGYDWDRLWSYVPEDYVVAGRLLAELGRPALDYLSGRIGEFDPVAWKLAGFTGSKELRELLVTRLEKEENPNARGLIRNAIERLGAARPASAGR